MFFLHIQGATSEPRKWSAESWRLMDRWKKQLSRPIINLLWQRHDKDNPKTTKWYKGD